MKTKTCQMPTPAQPSQCAGCTGPGPCRKPTEEKSDWVDTQEVCNRFHLSKRTVARYREKGVFSYCQPGGGKIFYDMNEIICTMDLMRERKRSAEAMQEIIAMQEMQEFDNAMIQKLSKQDTSRVTRHASRVTKIKLAQA